VILKLINLDICAASKDVTLNDPSSGLFVNTIVVYLGRDQEI
jgi:hypothetical protein